MTIKEKQRTLFVLGLIALIVAALLKAAWAGDDSFFTFRVVENFWGGFGLRWNVDERVQVSTHTLWLLILIVVRPFFNDPYRAALGASIFFSALVSWRILNTSRRYSELIFLVVILISSLTFIDYGASCLENPLSNLLGIMLLEAEYKKRGVRRTALITSLFILTRPEAFLIAVPFLVSAFIRSSLSDSIRELFVGSIPVITWEVFSIFYYGFPFPNTAYAKLGSVIPASERIFHGLYYLQYLGRYDPITLLTILGALLFAFFGGSRSLPFAIGVVLYVGWIVWSGGDFMAFRFFTIPFVMSLTYLARQIQVLSVKALLGASFSSAMLIWCLPQHTVINDDRASVPEFNSREGDGIANERAFFYADTGLFYDWDYSAKIPRWNWDERRSQKARGNKVFLDVSPGMDGFTFGPKYHLVDQIGLGDALIARIPYIGPWVRSGHHSKSIPKGYIETLESGENQIVNQYIREYYDNLHEIIAGDLFSSSRLKLILEFNFGMFDYLLDGFRSPIIREISVDELPDVTSSDRSWNGPGVMVLSRYELQIRLGEDVFPIRLVAHLDQNDTYRFNFYREGKLIGDKVVISPAARSGELVEVTVEIPNSIRQSGFDMVGIVNIGEDPIASVGSLRFED